MREAIEARIHQMVKTQNQVEDIVLEVMQFTVDSY